VVIYIYVGNIFVSYDDCCSCTGQYVFVDTRSLPIHAFIYIILYIVGTIIHPNSDILYYYFVSRRTIICSLTVVVFTYYTLLSLHYIRAIFTYFTVGYFVTVQLQRCSGLHTTTGGNGELKVCARSLTRSLVRVCVCLYITENQRVREDKKNLYVYVVYCIYSVLVCL